jgi:hypothetical protein
MRRFDPLWCAALTCVLVFALGCGGTGKPVTVAPGGEDGGGVTVGPTSIPRPTVVIKPWTRPGTGDPIVLGITISDKGTHAFLAGVSPSESRIEIEGFNAEGLSQGTQRIAFDPALWTNGGRDVDISPAAALITKSTKMSFRIFINAQLGSDPVFVVTDMEP